jgi:hypothetical protein
MRIIDYFKLPSTAAIYWLGNIKQIDLTEINLLQNSVARMENLTCVIKKKLLKVC